MTEKNKQNSENNNQDQLYDKVLKYVQQKIQNDNILEFLQYLSKIIVNENPLNFQSFYELVLPLIRCNVKLANQRAEEFAQQMFKDLQKILGQDQAFANDLKTIIKPIQISSLEILSEREMMFCHKDMTKIHTLKISSQTKDNTLQPQDYKAKRHDKEQMKQEKETLKRIQELQEVHNRLPKVQVQHDRSGKYSSTQKIDNFSLEVNGKILIENQQLLINEGRRYGLVGQNGIGKTTLLYAFARKEIQGMNMKPQILMIEQEVPITEKTPLEMVLETDGDMTELLKQQEILNVHEDTQKLLEIQEKLAQINVSQQINKAQTILKLLGFTEQMQNHFSKNLSGGWRMRIALAKILFCEPDILLLDEPTNHLDIEAVLWLQEYLQSLNSTLIIVSHAREFLNQVCTDIIHIENQKLNYYKGNFDQFLTIKEQNQICLESEYKTQQAKIQHIQTFIDKFRYSANRAALVQSRIK